MNTAITITSDDYKLAGNMFVAQPPQQPIAFLFIQGWQAHQNVKAAQKLAELGYTCLTYDMRGNGDSEGNIADFSRADFINDAINVYDYFQQQLDKGIRIGVVGSSFGGYSAVLLANFRDVDCLSLRVPAGYPDEGFGEPLQPHVDTEESQKWRLQQLSYGDNHALQALYDFKGQVQIIESADDQQVPHQTVQNYVNAVADASKLSYSVMANAPHSLVNDDLKREYGTLLTDWVQKLKS